MSFITTKFQEILLSGLRGVGLTKNKTDGLMDRWVKNIIPSATRYVGYEYGLCLESNVGLSIHTCMNTLKCCFPNQGI